MERKGQYMRWRYPACLLVAAAALANSGWLTAAAVGAAGAGDAYYQGKVSRDFYAGYEDPRAAAHTALAELGLPLLGEERTGADGALDSRTSRGETVRISLETLPAPVPADGARTRVGVRVGTFGDHSLGERIF